MTAAPDMVSLKPVKSQSVVNLNGLLNNMEQSGLVLLDETKGVSAPICVGIKMCAN